MDEESVQACQFSWVRYSKYEWKKDKNNKYYITPAPDAMPQIYDPLQDCKAVYLPVSHHIREQAMFFIGGGDMG